MATHAKKSNLRNLLFLLVFVGFGCGLILAVKPEALLGNWSMEQRVDGVLRGFAENTVIATLERLVEDTDALEAASRRLREAPTKANVEAAAAAWRSTRATAQLTNAFAFGPAAHYNFDKQLATWPLDRPLVEHTLAEMEAGRLQLDARILRERMYSTRRGLLAAEYLLFRDGQPRSVENLRPAEFDYLVVTARALRLEAMDYLAAWSGTEHLPTDWATELEAAGFKPRRSYAAEFAGPGEAQSRYVSSAVALQEVMGDAVTVAEELCPAIQEILSAPDPGAAETADSRNGFADLLTTLEGLENAYYGGVDGARGHAVSDLVAGIDDVLDRRIQIALADTAYRIEAAGDPFLTEIDADRELRVRVAVSACEKLFTRLELATPLITMHPVTLPWAPYGVFEVPSVMRTWL